MMRMVNLSLVFSQETPSPAISLTFGNSTHLNFDLIVSQPSLARVGDGTELDNI